MRRIARTLGVAALAALAAPGCNVSQEGAVGAVIFTPDECGRLAGCDFADGIGTGGTIQVWIRGSEGVSTAGFDLRSADELVFTVAPIADQAGRPTWEIQTGAQGVGMLYAVDRNGSDVDFIEVPVQDVTALGLENIVGDATGPQSDDEFDEIWQVNADQPTSFETQPLIGVGVTTMGVFHYQVGLDAAMVAGLLEGANVDAGYLYFQVPAGSYMVDLDNGAGALLHVRIDAVAGT